VTAPGIRVPGTWRFAEASWNEALDEIERLARAAGDSVVLALSGSETVEIAAALSQLVRKGFGSHRVVLPEETSTVLDPFRAPLSAIADAEIVVVVGDDPVAERAPIVDLWIRQARRNGAEVLTFGPAGSVQHPPGDGPAVVAGLADKRKAVGKRLHAAERVALIWSGPGGRGGATLAPLAEALGLGGKPGSGAYFLPATPNGRGVAAAWEGAGEGEPGGAPERVGLLLISGEEAVADPRVRALAERSDAVAAVTMFSESVRGWTHVVLPGTSYLERDGTMVNLDGREQRLRKATEPPSRGDLDWIAELAARFGVTIEPFSPSDTLLQGAQAVPAVEPQKPPVAPKLRLTRYRALFSGSAVERVPQLQFQRPEAVIELSPEDAKKRSIGAGETVTVLANGTSVELRARINRRLVAGAARAAEEHVRNLPDLVEVRP
jgi:NADH-quinone oxidoreductase subunit G